MYTFKILTAPPGFFTGGLTHYSSEEELMMVFPDEENDESYHGGVVNSFYEETNTYSEDEIENDLDVFSGMPLYVDSINTDESTLNSLIHEDFANVFGGLDENELENIFDPPETLSVVEE